MGYRDWEFPEFNEMGESATKPMGRQADIEPDMVNHPPHYTSGNIECIDAMQAASTGDEFKAFCRLNAMKYIWRAGKKWDSREDINKAIWYLERSINVDR